MTLNANAYIFGGLALAIISILLTEQNYCGGGLDGILAGDWIANIGIQTRWPLTAAAILACWGFYKRANSS